MALPATFPFPAERDKANNIKVRADHFDANMEFLINLISNSLSRFGANKMQGNIDANNKTFKNIATPIESGDVANKQYVDGLNQQLISRNPQLVPALLQLATQDETLAGAVTNKAVSPATLALAISSAISASATNLPYGFLGGFDLAFSNNTQITIGVGQATSSDNSRNIIGNFIANKDISTLWAPSNGESTVVGGRPSNVPLNPWSRYNVFAISTEPSPATHGTFTTADLSANVDNFKGVSDGFLRVVIDGVNKDYQNLDFSLIQSLNDIALVLKNAIDGADVNVVEGTLVFTSNATGATSTVNLATVPGGVGTDITTTTYLNIAAGTVENGQNYVYSVVDFGIDQGNNFSASNLLATTGTAYQAGFRNYRYIGYLVVGQNSTIVSITGANDETEFNKIRQYRGCCYADFPNILNKGINLGLNATNFYTMIPGYLPATSNVKLGIVNGVCYAYWGTDGIRRFMLPDTKLRDWLGGYYGVTNLTDSTTGQTVSAWNLPGLMENEAYRRTCNGSNAAQAQNIGTFQPSAAPNITGSAALWGAAVRYGNGAMNVAYNPQNSQVAQGGATGNSIGFNARLSSTVYTDGLSEIRVANFSQHTFVAY